MVNKTYSFSCCFPCFCKKDLVNYEVKEVAKVIQKKRIFAPHPQHRKMLVSTEIVDLTQVLKNE